MAELGRECEIGWQPTVLAPVFYGTSDFSLADGPAVRMRVFFPTIDGSPQNAAILTGCGRYPLIAFLHGHCELQRERHKLWLLHPAQLARSGYVVVVPELRNYGPFDSSNPEIAQVLDVLTWMRSSWSHAAALLPPPMTAVVGHSWGAMLGGHVARNLALTNSCSAYASLSGGWVEHPLPRPLSALNMATMFMWGTGIEIPEPYAQLEGPNDAVWHETPGATHKVVFRGGEHWDYLQPGISTCETTRGPCELIQSLSADFLTSFLSHYVPPHPSTNSAIPHSLTIPLPLNLTLQQEFYAGGHLQGFAQIGTATGCSVKHTWRLPPFGGGSVTLP